MAVTKYTKSIATHFSGSFDGDNWKTEIQDSSITIQIDHTIRSGDTLDTWFKAELSEAEETTFDALPAAHDSTPTPPVDTVNILNEDKTVWHQAISSAKTPITIPNIVPPGYIAYITGAFDDIETPARGSGDQMVVEQDGSGEETLSGRFLEHFYVLNGSYHEDGNADIRDWVSMHLYAEASTPTSTPGAGNAAKVSYGPGNVIIPAEDGDWTVDGETLEAGEINENLVPLPAYDADGNPNGNWDWDPTASPSITPALGVGHYNLLDFAAGIIGRQANRLPLKGSCESCVPEVVKGKKILPHWTIVFTIHRHVTGSAAVAFEMKIARKNTV